MDKTIRSRRGGPRTFDRSQALEVAMRLFWRSGYEGVSINNLTSAMGIAPPSLYAAFGSKAGLYREALDRYAVLRGTQVAFQDADSLLNAVTVLFHEAIDAVSDPQWGSITAPILRIDNV